MFIVNLSFGQTVTIDTSNVELALIDSLALEIHKDSLINKNDSLRIFTNAPEGLFSNRNFALSGSLTSENFQTNYQDPYTRSELSYSRFYGGLSMDIFGIPISSQFYLTSEDNSVYNSNYFTYQIDVSTLKEQLKSKSDEIIRNKSLQKDSIEEELSELKKDYTLDKFELQKIENRERSLRDSLNRFTEEFKNKEQVESQKIDSLIYEKNPLQDSLRLVYKEKRQLDSLNVLLNALESKKEFLNEQINTRHTKILNLRHQSDSLLTVISDLNDPDKLKKLEKSRFRRINSLIKVSECISKFNFGLTYPVFSEYSLNGVPVKGADIELTIKDLTLSIAGGKTFETESNIYLNSLKRPAFTRNVVATKFILNSGANSEFSASSVHFFDPIYYSAPKYNLIHSLGWSGNLVKRLKITSEIFHSALNEKISYKVYNESGDLIDEATHEKAFQNLAFDVMLDFNIVKGLDLKTAYKRINPGYVNLGNPFMRSNFQEINAELHGTILKNRLRISTFYKGFNDNLGRILESTNKMQGYGINASTQFKKGPNFGVLHTPYKQGNNNPDTLFRTDNQLSITSVNMIHSFNHKSLFVSVIGLYTNSEIEFRGGEQLISNSMYQISLSLSNKSWNMQLAASRNIAGEVDTLNFYGYRMNLAYTSKNKVKLTLFSMFDQFDNKAYRNRNNFSVRFQATKKCTAQISTEYGVLKRIYGLNHKDVWSGSLMLQYIL